MKKICIGLMSTVLIVCFQLVIHAQGTLPVKNTLDDKNWKTVPAHPRLFANDARIGTLKLQNDQVSKDLLLLLKNNAEKTLLAKRIEYPTTGFKFGAVRNVQGRILTLGLGYRVFDDKRYLDRAKSELMQLAELPNCLALTPPMGWNSWNKFACEINEKLIRKPRMSCTKWI